MMQTWLPLPDFAETALVLDDERLAECIKDAEKVVEANKNGKAKLLEHPSAVMWRGYGLSLVMYGQEMCDEWYRRKQEPHPRAQFFTDLLDTYAATEIQDPPWLGDPMFHACQRSNLLRKNPLHYRRLWPLEAADAVLVWPVVRDDGDYRFHVTEEDAKKAYQGKRHIYVDSEGLL